MSSDALRVHYQGLEPVWLGILALGCEERLHEIDLRSNRPPWSVASFGGEFSNDHSRVFGCRFRGEIIGFAVVHIVEPEAHILNFAIAQEYRGMGVGKQLLQFIFDCLNDPHCHAMQNHSIPCDSISLEVRRSNMAALTLYENFGFDIVGERLRYYPDDAEDALVMRAVIGTAERAFITAHEDDLRS